MSENSDLREEAHTVVKQYIEHGRGAEGSTEAYSNSGVKYEQYMEVLNYGGPRKTAEIVADLVKDNFDIKVLDIGAGTGLAGEELVKLGYKNLDAVDAAEGLLEVARKKQIYDRIVCQFVGNEKLPFDDGGYIVTVFRAEAEKAPWYKEGLEVYMSQLEEEGLWKLQFRTTFPNFIADKEGLVLVHKVL